MIKLCIIDDIGLSYDGSTLSKRGLGGSESSVISIARELVKIGFEVVVINDCSSNGNSPGIYDGVEYISKNSLFNNKEFNFDIVISSRTVIPFLPAHLYNQFSDYNPELYSDIKKNAKLKIVWLHDTFCKGDHLLEDMIIYKDIDEIFTLSDFHTSYVLNCDHGKKRMFEVLKNKTFVTRNGINVYEKKSPKYSNVFVYNASVTKGMIPLVNEVWPKVKKQIPEAYLKVIGGFYKFRDGAAPDEQEKIWRSMVNDKKYSDLDIEFTGIISQREISEILSTATFTIYPTAFPETFGISSLESIYYNTPIITNRFGALEEIALENSCYLLDYPIEPNNLFQHINKEEQVDKFVDLVVKAFKDKYLYEQKVSNCNIIKDICTWDTVALQWKQHFFNKLSLHLDVNEYRKVSKINWKVRDIFNKRIVNKEDLYIPRNKEHRLNVITPVYNAENYIEKCINSVLCQDYSNYRFIIIDDLSTDGTREILSKYENNPRIEVLYKKVNEGALYNQILCLDAFTFNSSDIIVLLDGDDWLEFDNQIFQYINNIYHEGYLMTYGSCWSEVDNIPLIAQEYPENVKEGRSYRDYKFQWNVPYTHLRTFSYKLFNNINLDNLKDSDGKYFKAGGDIALLYELLENSDGNKIKVIQKILYRYNDKNPINDYKVNGEEQTKNANEILKINEVNKNKNILIAIPTAKYICPETFKSIYDLEIPEGYRTTFQYFYGYDISQVRNLIANWSLNYDYLFFVDSDISFPQDTLKKLLAWNKDIVSGLYIQRKPGQHILELYNEKGNIPYQEIKNKGLVEILGCGFGCVLINCDVIRNTEYPHFFYKSAIDHKDTVSEDVYFCDKAREKGYKIYADTSVICNHHGETVYNV